MNAPKPNKPNLALANSTEECENLKHDRDLYHTSLNQQHRERVLIEQERDSLRQQLEEANGKLQKLYRLLELSQAADDAKTDTEIAASASFQEALALTNADIVEEENTELKRQLLSLAASEAKLREALKNSSSCLANHATFNSDTPEGRALRINDAALLQTINQEKL